MAVADEASTFRRRHHATVNALWIGIQFQDAALLAIIVPAIVLQLSPRSHTAILAALATLASTCATLVPPIAGTLSDRSRRGGSDRRIQTGIALGVDALALVVMGVANSTFSLGFALGVSAIALSTASTIYQALLPEVVPRHAWGISSGVRGALTLLGTIAGLLVAALINPRWALFTTAGAVALGTLTLMLVPEPRNGNGNGDAGADAPQVGDRHDLIVTLIGRACIVLGMTLLNTYVLYFFADVLHVKNAPLRTGLTATGALGGAIVSSIVAGIVSDRFDRRYVVALAGLPMTLAGIGFALYPTPGALVGYAALFGLGFGAVFSVGWALALDSIPEMGDLGRDLGIWSTLSGLPAIGAPALGAFVIAHGATLRDGYRTLFVIASMAFAAGSLVVLKVRPRRSRSA